MAGYKVDTSDLEKISAQFQAASRNARRNHRAGLKEVGTVVADAARTNIAGVSPRTAASIRVGARGASGISITSGSKALPIAALLEGNGRPGTFSHPLFGDRAHWYTEPTHPYVWPAFEEKRLEVNATLLKFLSESLRDEGLDVAGAGESRS